MPAWTWRPKPRSCSTEWRDFRDAGHLRILKLGASALFRCVDSVVLPLEKTGMRCCRGPTIPRRLSAGTVGKLAVSCGTRKCSAKYCCRVSGAAIIARLAPGCSRSLVKTAPVPSIVGDAITDISAEEDSARRYRSSRRAPSPRASFVHPRRCANKAVSEQDLAASFFVSVDMIK